MGEWRELRLEGQTGPGAGVLGVPGNKCAGQECHAESRPVKEKPDIAWYLSSGVHPSQGQLRRTGQFRDWTQDRLAQEAGAGWGEG